MCSSSLKQRQVVDAAFWCPYLKCKQYGGLTVSHVDGSVAGLGSSVSFEGSGNAGLLLLRLLQTDSGSIRITRISRYKPQVEMWTAESDPEGRNASVG